jgi:outer membrane protein assembly factor BamB
MKSPTRTISIATALGLALIGSAAASASASAPVTPRWSVSTGKTYLNVAMGKSGTVVLGTNKTMEIRRTTNGSLVCTSGNYGQATLAPVVDAATNRVYVGTTNGYVLALSATNCGLLAVASGPGGPALVAYGNGVVAAAFPERLEALRLQHLIELPLGLRLRRERRARAPIHQRRGDSAGQRPLHRRGECLHRRFALVPLLELQPRRPGPRLPTTGASMSPMRATMSTPTTSPTGPCPGRAIWAPPDNSWAQRAKGRVYLTGANGKFYSINSSNGLTMCMATVGGSFNSRAAADSTTGSTYATNTNGKTYKFSSSCATSWSYTTGQYALSGPAYQQGQPSVYAVGSGKLYSFAK